MNRCSGCGIILQENDDKLDGYVSSLDYSLCSRCFMIKNYGKNKIVSKNNIDYMKIINQISDNDLVIYVSSILTLNLDFINKFKKVILVVTKRDIIPKSVKDDKIIKYIKNKYNNILDIVIISTFKKYNLDNLYNILLKYGNNLNIYFVGLTNSGKSSLINELIKCYGNDCGNITTSNYPSTTLDSIDINLNNLLIKDTPGILLDDSIINYLDNKYIKKINSLKEIKPITFQIKGSGVILIDELFRIEYDTNISSITFYVSNNLKVKRYSIKNKILSNLEYNKSIILNNQDLVIEDIGFIKCTNKCNFKVYCNTKFYSYVRENLI